MFIHHQFFSRLFSRRHLWRLGLAAQMVVCCGCLSTGKRVAETRDPFLAPTALTTPAPAGIPGRLPSVADAELAETAVEATIELAAYETEGSAPEVLLNPPVAELEQVASVETEEYFAPSMPESSLPFDSQNVVTEGLVIEQGTYPIDLGNALGLGGADNLQVRLARTRLFQAQARHLAAKTLWLPSLRVGIGYNKHDGRLQETAGNVIEVERNSLFYGGGFGLGGVPLAGGAGGPPRLMVNLSLADAYFKPLAACQEVAGRGAAERVATNDSLAQIAVSYHSLLEAYGRVANAVAAREMTQEMVTLVEILSEKGLARRPK